MSLGEKLIFLLGVCLGIEVLWVAADQSTVCRDDDGSPVDWFAAIKVPRERYLPQHEDQYFIYTSKDNAWRLSKGSVSEDKANGAIYNTASQAYKFSDNDSVVSLAYNDERPPELTTWHESGHMKGVLTFTAGGPGFWLIHSVPKFPGLSSYIYPSTGYEYGQHFLCVSFDFSQLASIAHQLLLASPNVFFYHLPPSIGEKVPDLQKLTSNDRPFFDNTKSLQSLKSSAGESFLHFSKSSAFGRDLYDSFVAPGLKTSLFMEGWIDGAGDLNSSCDTEYHVYNIKKITLGQNTWKTSRDHSKWVVSEESSNPWVCLGDINRQKSQSRRGGGTLCHSDPNLWKAFRAMVADYSPCPHANFAKVSKSDFDIL